MIGEAAAMEMANWSIYSNAENKDLFHLYND